MIVAAVTTPFPSVVRVIGLLTFNSCVHPRPGAGPKDIEDLMARKVNRFVASPTAGDVVPENSCWFKEMNIPDCANCWQYVVPDALALSAWA